MASDTLRHASGDYIAEFIEHDGLQYINHALARLYHGRQNRENLEMFYSSDIDGLIDGMTDREAHYMQMELELTKCITHIVRKA
ncbi:unnamed protein product, partial [Chrysoparadoxa australica]